MAWVKGSFFLCIPEAWNVPTISREGKAWTCISQNFQKGQKCGPCCPIPMIRDYFLIVCHLCVKNSQRHLLNYLYPNKSLIFFMNLEALSLNLSISNFGWCSFNCSRFITSIMTSALAATTLYSYGSSISLTVLKIDHPFTFYGH